MKLSENEIQILIDKWDNQPIHYDDEGKEYSPLSLPQQNFLHFAEEIKDLKAEIAALKEVINT